ncbi:MAG: hypothetical protein ACQER9_01810 [Nanobdellota archaeon]
MNKGKIIILLISFVALFGAILHSASISLGTPIVLLGQLTLFIYTPLHAKKNGHSMPLWGALTFFFSFIASLIYVFCIKSK